MEVEMKQFLAAFGVIVLLVGVLTVSGVAAGTSETDEDCQCLASARNRAEELKLLREQPELLLEQSESVQMEWVCETYRTVTCLDWDTEPNPACALGCGALCAPVWQFGIAAYTACVGLCVSACPDYRYCVDFEIEEIITCGWVLVE
jgi:hypothetical protein